VFIEFCKKVGIVAGAAAGVIFLVNMVTGFAWTTATRPIMDAIASEARAREEADREITHELSRLSQDRLDLIDVMLTEPGVARTRKLREVRSRWEAD